MRYKHKLFRRKHYERFRAEAEQLHPDDTDAQKHEWAVHCAVTHPDTRIRWKWPLIVIGAVIIFLLGYSAAKAETPEEAAARLVESLHTQPAPLFAQIVGGPNTARMQVRDGTGAWVDVGAVNSIPVSCTSGCGGASAFLDNSAFTVGTTPISLMGAYYTSGADPTLSSGNAGRLRIDSHSYLLTNCVVGCSGGSTTPSDAFANPTTATLAASFLLGWNGTTWDRLKSTTANGLQVDVTRVQGSVAVTGTFFQATQPVSLSTLPALTAGSAVIGHVIVDTAPTTAVSQSGSWTVTTTPPSNASTNIAQLAGTITDTNSGVKSAGTLRVVLATDQPALTNKLLVTPDSVALPANQSVNVNQFGGSAVVTGTGAAGSGIPRVTISNDSSLAANQSVNVNQIGGSSVSTAATGIQKVGITGNAGAAIDAANNAAAPANVIADGAETATQTSTQPTAATAGNMRRLVARTDGALYVVPGGPVMWSCGLNAIGTTLTQCQAAPGASLRLYITDIIAQSNTSTAGLFTVRFGTGSNCGTGTGNLFFASASALIAAPANTAPVDLIHLSTPIAVTANNAICVLGVATNTTNIQINGYTAP